ALGCSDNQITQQTAAPKAVLAQQDQNDNNQGNVPGFDRLQHVVVIYLENHSFTTSTGPSPAPTDSPTPAPRPRSSTGQGIRSSRSPRPPRPPFLRLSPTGPSTSRNTCPRT